MNASMLQDDRGWQRVLQTSTYPFDPAALIGGNLVVDDDVAQMNDLARIVELAAKSPFFTGVLLDNDGASGGDYWSDNLFTWDSATNALYEPPRFVRNFDRYRKGAGLVVAALKLTVEGVWNFLIFDLDRRRVDRLDTDVASKALLDKAIIALLAERHLAFDYVSPDVTGAGYRQLIGKSLIPWQCPKNIQSNMWAYWMLYARLFFGDSPYQDVLDDLCRNVANVTIGDLLLNFYSSFTSDANLHAFGSIDFVAKYPSAQDIWRYGPLIAQRVAKIANAFSWRTPLNQLLCAAMCEFQNANGGADYANLYESYTKIAPLFAPKGQDGVGWIPRELLDPSIEALLGGGTLSVGYIDNPPYVFSDPKGSTTLRGIDHDLVLKLKVVIEAHYAGAKLNVAWVAVKPADMSETGKFEALYAGLADGKYNVAMSGQLRLDGDELPPGDYDPEWTCATAMIFTNITYTGRGNLDFASLKGKTRTDLIDHIVKTYPTTSLSFFSVTNPGPSYLSATNLVRDIVNAGGVATWVTGTVDESSGVLKNAEVHFTVGDGIQNAYQCATIAPKATYLNMPAVDAPAIFYDKNVNSATLLPLAAFTLK
jgi:hypothetical protein